MKKTVVLLVGLLLVFFGFSAGAQTQAAPKALTFKAGTFVVLEGAWGQGMVRFKELVEKNSNGAMKVELGIGPQLGSDEDMSQQLELNAIQVYWSGDYLISQSVPEWDVFGSPYAIKDSAHLKRVFGSDIGKDIQTRLIQKRGIRVFTDAIATRTPRMLWAKSPIKNASDVKNVKMRVPGLKSYVDAWKAVGANVTPVPWPELFGALQTGIVDMFEGDIPPVYAMGGWQVCKYMIPTKHITGPVLVFMNEKWWKTLNSEQQGIIQEAAKEAQKLVEKIGNDEEGKFLAEMKTKGVVVVDNVDVSSFVRAVSGLSAESVKSGRWMPDTFSRIQALRN